MFVGLKKKCIFAVKYKCYKAMNGNKIIGREQEQRVLASICEEEEARLVAVYGRRRVGKTYLVKNYFKGNFDFFFTGSFETPASVQLALFNNELKSCGKKDYAIPKDWFEAFGQLKDYLMGVKKKHKVVFLDELPWLDTPKSNFLNAFSFFWNSWASTCNGLKVIVCGSATSWMLDKVIGDKGGLYGRTSRSIYLAPFTLGEVEAFLREKKRIHWSRYQMLECYMIFGGIPYYLDMLDRSLPFSENVDNLFFKGTAPLKVEYEFLFRSLFKSSAIYKQVVEALATKNKGMSQSEIKAAIGAENGGTLSRVLANLCSCDFIRKYSAYGKKSKDGIYQLTDLYSLFFLKFIGKRTGLDEHYWSNVKEGKKNAWLGYAFEQVCLHHISQIKGKLSIKGVLTNVCAWRAMRHVDKDGNEWPGVQLDLLLCRADNVIDVCEMKYSKGEFVITRAYDSHLRERNSVFAQLTKTRDAIHTVIVTTWGLKQNFYSGNVQAVVTMDDLFETQ